MQVVDGEDAQCRTLGRPDARTRGRLVAWTPGRLDGWMAGFSIDLNYHRAFT